MGKPVYVLPLECEGFFYCCTLWMLAALGFRRCRTGNGFTMLTIPAIGVNLALLCETVQLRVRCFSFYVVCIMS